MSNKEFETIEDVIANHDEIFPTINFKKLKEQAPTIEGAKTIEEYAEAISEEFKDRKRILEAIKDVPQTEWFGNNNE